MIVLAHFVWGIALAISILKLLTLQDISATTFRIAVLIYMNLLFNRYMT